MKRLSALVTAVCLLFGGCGPSPEQVSENSKAHEEAERRIAAEAQQRAAAESRLREEHESTTRWQSATVLAATMAAFALIFGAILGSRARDEASKK